MIEFLIFGALIGILIAPFVIVGGMMAEKKITKQIEVAVEGAKKNEIGDNFELQKELYKKASAVPDAGKRAYLFALIDTLKVEK